MRHLFPFVVISAFATVISCKNGAPSNEVAPIETVKNEVSLNTKQEGGFIGLWTVPVTTQLTTNIRLYYDEKAGIYYTKEKDSNTSKQDSLVVVIKKKDAATYTVEYARRLEDNYVITADNRVTWKCPGYADVKCGGNIDLEKLASTYELYKGSSSPKPSWADAIKLTSKEKADFYEWSKKYVKMSVIEPETLVFPGISAVKYSQKENRYRVEYKVSGKDLYNNNVAYPISILFEKDENGEPTFLSIATE